MLEALLRTIATELDVAKVSVKQITKTTIENYEQGPSKYYRNRYS